MKQQLKDFSLIVLDPLIAFLEQMKIQMQMQDILCPLK